MDTNPLIRTREDVRRYIEQLEEKSGNDLPKVRTLRKVAHAILLIGLVCAYLQFYFLSILVEIERLPRVTVFTALPKGCCAGTAPASRASAAASP